MSQASVHGTAHGRFSPAQISLSDIDVYLGYRQAVRSIGCKPLALLSTLGVYTSLLLLVAFKRHGEIPTR